MNGDGNAKSIPVTGNDERDGVNGPCFDSKETTETLDDSATVERSDDEREEDENDEEDLADPAGPGVESTPHLSKKALKRLKKKEMWIANKGQRRAAERERRKKRAAEDRQKRLENPEDANLETFHQLRKKLKKNKMSTSSCRVSVVIDCNWEHLMELKDVQKLAKQIQYAYTTNRRLAEPLQFIVTSLREGSMLKEKLDKDYAGYKNWDVYFKADDYHECFEKEKIVYLTSESEVVLERLEEDKVYVIGGLVDHNQHKGVCHSTAVSRGIAHARLPIDEFLEMKTRKVLTVNHVFDILASATGGASWKDAFVAAIPSRKGAVAKDDGREGGVREEDTGTTINSNEESNGVEEENIDTEDASGGQKSS